MTNFKKLLQTML